MKKLLLIVFAMCFITAQAQKHPRFDNTKKEYKGFNWKIIKD